MSGIYRIRNTVNGKVYIGCTSRAFYYRKKEHFKELSAGTHNNPYLQKSFNKHGENAFVFEILEECAEDRIDELERKYFFEVPEELRYNCKIPNYNKRGGKISDETKRKMSIVKTGKKHTKKSREKMSRGRMGEKNPMYGKTHTEEAKKKLSKAMKGREFTEETRRKLSEANRGEKNYWYGKKSPFYGRKHTPETLVKMSGENHPQFGKVGKENATSKPIKQIDIETGETINVFESIREAAKAIGSAGSVSGICAVANGRQKTCKGFIWKHAED